MAKAGAPVLAAIGAAIDGAADAPRLAESGDASAYGARPDGEGDQLDRRPSLPDDCPVQPLGILDTRCFYLDVRGQIVALDAGNRHGKNSLIALFGERSGWLEANFAQWSAPQFEGRAPNKVLVKPSEVVGFDQADASRALIEACVVAGIFDPTGKIRGRGAHRSRAGSGPPGLVFHVGDKVLAASTDVYGKRGRFEWHKPGVADGYVYPTAAPIPRPWHASVDASPARALLALLKTWMWRRELLDPMLLLGWIATAPIGGALDWRPNIWITGGPGTGKSTLNGEGGVLDMLFGEGLFKTGNASAAAIRQSLKNSTVPVVFDEIEASEDNRRVREVLEIARVSSSGATIHRGGADHQASEFTLRSCFQFSSINIPPLEPQDRSRLAILELGKFAAGTPPPKLAAMNLPAIGAQIVRRMIDGWHRWPDTLHAYQLALADAGHSPRACDQFGTLLAAAHVLLHDDLSDAEVVSDWAGKCNRRAMMEISDATPDEEACVVHLLTSMAQARGSEERESIGTWLGKAINLPEPDNVRRRLKEIGLAVVTTTVKPAKDGGEPATGARDLTQGAPGYLAVANSHQSLAAIYAGTKWQGGVWRQSLGRHEGAIGGVDVKMGHQKARATLVPLRYLLDASELPAGTPDFDGEGGAA